MSSVQRRGARHAGSLGTEKKAPLPASFAASLDGSDDTSDGVRRANAATRTIAWTDALLHPFGLGRGEQHSGGMLTQSSSGTVDDSALIMTRDEHDDERCAAPRTHGLLPSHAHARMLFPQTLMSAGGGHLSLLVPLVPQSPSAATLARVRELKSSLVARGASKGSPVRTESPMGVERNEHRFIVPQSVVQAVRRVLKPVVRPLPALPTCSRRTAVMSLAAVVCCGAGAAAAVVGPARVVATVAAVVQQAWLAMPSQAAVQSRLNQGNLALVDFRYTPAPS
jgi:hypothetical protein